MQLRNIMAGGSSNLQCRRRRNTDNQNRPNVHLEVIQRREPRMVGALPSCALCRVNRGAKLCSKSAHVGHAHSQGLFEVT
jgi:hypothetical protein